LLTLGVYLVYNFTSGQSVPFPLAVVMSMIVTAGVALLFERLVLRRMLGNPVFAQVMVTIGLLFILQNLVIAIWGAEPLNLGDPWGISTISIGEVIIEVRDLWTAALAIGVLVVFFLFFRFSKLGLAMRATAVDQEAALAQGMSSRQVYMAAWGIAGATAAIAGVGVAAGATGVSPSVEFVALLAFPAIILGGIDSPLGAVIGGLIIGVTQSLTAGYQNELFPWLWAGFDDVMPFIVMVLVLLVRPYGLFGTPEIKRV
jgi:branched-chain amino acid transport system permease protein